MTIAGFFSFVVSLKNSCQKNHQFKEHNYCTINQYNVQVLKPTAQPPL